VGSHVRSRRGDGLKRSLWAILIAAPLVTLLALGFGHNPDASGSPLLDRAAPNFSLQSLDGRTVSLKSVRGKPVVLNFWASWCTSCKAEHPFLMSAWRRYGPKGVVFLGVDFRDSPSAARDFVRQNAVRWPALQDPDDATAVDYGVSGIPETFLIDRRGFVRYHFPGPVTSNALQVQLHLLVGRSA
jgi:cytochrome c biogenesis protein CcmG, thiol:disulfide interchange protein DsbE